MRLKSVEPPADKRTQVLGKGGTAALRILLVDDDPALRTLLKTTFEVADVAVVEAEDAAAARRKIRSARPDVIVLDVNMPGTTGLELCAELKAAPATRDIPIVLLTGSEGGTEAAAKKAGANAFVRKPFSPLELLAVAERLAGGVAGIPFRTTKKNARGPDEELLLYARDLRHMLEVERGQRELLQSAYLQTVSALASALESKDTGTRAHSHRVQSYATALAEAAGVAVVRNESTAYGFLLHDVGKIGIPDGILQKPGPLSSPERRKMETHTVLGEAMLSGVVFLKGDGLKIVRSHHERWDGRGYPDGLVRDEIPLGARIFAVADALDAMTSHRPYRRAMSWSAAHAEILEQRKRQFDPDVVDAFLTSEPTLLEIRRELVAA
ncbi:MAG TPA: HD domain-containing phosphohydrolase [Gaiellaceae bacterium]|jgi:response regulator RpfG family c-di-GMP phosphodiesterase|nr:HD domain-containing phosphohydrolase [Gaiellaceae bacterium]